LLRRPRRRGGLWRHRILLLWLGHDVQVDEGCDASGLLHTKQAQSPLSKVGASPMCRTRSLRSSWIGASLFPHMSGSCTRVVVGVVDDFENEVFFENERRKVRGRVTCTSLIPAALPKVRAKRKLDLCTPPRLSLHDLLVIRHHSFPTPRRERPRFGSHSCHDAIFMITHQP
jgi:hypothetical protein